MGACIYCKHHRCEFGKQPDGFIPLQNCEESVLGVKYVKCDVGYNDKMIEWYNNNRNKTTDQLSDIDCYDDTDLIKLMNKVIDVGNRALEN